MSSSDNSTNPPESDPGLEATLAAEDLPTALVQVLDQYLADLQAGKTPDRAKLLAEHPQLATRLEQCLSGIEFVHRTSHCPDETPSVLGDFRIHREVGRGGMGVVYEAEQISLKRTVALKVLRFGGVADVEAVQRFQREAETIAALDHGHIVPVYAVGSANGVHYYAMQFIEGQSLAKLSSTSQDARDQTIGATPHQIARWGLAAAEALSHAHRSGVVHRDVKPSNLILDKDGQLWLTDFGLARRDIDATLSIAGALLGTPRYMSPEQAAAVKKPVDHRTDIYSLGATLYELATGKPVFDAETPQGVITQILNDLPPAPRKLDPQLPRDLETIILKCLEKEAADRYATAADLAGDLQAFLEDRSIRARQPTLVERGVQSLRRHRRVTSAAGLSAATALLLVIGSLLVSRFYIESRMGQVSFTTSGPRMVGEILNDNDETVVSSFPIPTTEPLKLPAGEYNVRLSADGLLSETWPIEVTRSQSTSLPVRFRSRWLWPPKELDPEAYSVIEVLPNETYQSADLLTVSHKLNEELELRETRVRRIDGRNGRSTWPDDLILRNDTVPEGREADGWTKLLSDSGVSGNDTRRLVRPVVDLNGDGHTDPVFHSRATPSLLALSGADGSVWWWNRARPTLPENSGPIVEDGQWAVHGRGSVIGTPAVQDVNGDGTADFIVCFVSESDTFNPASGPPIQVRQQCWLEAVSGSTGQPLWRFPLAANIGQSLRDSNASERLHRGCRIQTATVDGKQIAVTVLAKHLVGVSLQTGEHAWEPLELDFYPFRAPICRDLDGDESDELLMCRYDESEDEIIFLTFDLAAIAGNHQNIPIWQQRFHPAKDRHEMRDLRSDWYLVEDLDANGKSEIVAATGKFDYASGLGSRRRWSGVELIDGESGKPIWQRRLTVADLNQPPTVDRVAVAPDLNGDGHREVIAAWIGPSGPNPWEYETSIKVVALCGKEGSTLWRWQDPVASGIMRQDPIGSLQSWQPGPDGWPLLVVPVAKARGGQNMTYFLSASTGRLRHTLSDIVDPKVADFNGDGIVDLFYKVSPQGSPRMLAIAGSPQEPWKRLGMWRPIQDVNDDGREDFVRRYHLTVASGSDGRILWSAPKLPFSSPNYKTQLAPPAPQGDVDGDGTGDLFVLRSGTYIGGQPIEAGVAAVSGRDGSNIWNGAGNISLSGSGSGTINGWSYDYPAMEWTDLDHDEIAEILTVTHRRRRSFARWMLSVWSGKEGTVKWQSPIMPGSITGSPNPYGDEHSDLSDDGVGDLVLWVPVGGQEDKVDQSEAGSAVESSSAGTQTRSGDVADKTRPSTSNHENHYQLRAISGVDGRVLWSAPELSIENATDLLSPRPAVGDLDGDGAAEVIVATRGPWDKKKGYRNELIVLSGTDGSRRWSHIWYGNADILPPLLVSFEGGQRTVCVGVHDETYAVLFLNSDGKEINRIPLQPRLNFDRLVHNWYATDIDGDPGEELLFIRDGELVATRGADGQLWSWALPDDDSELITEAFTTRDREVVVWSGNSVFGLSAESGNVKWQCEGMVEPHRNSSHASNVRLLNCAKATDPPRVLFEGESSLYSFGTVVRQAAAVSPDGRFQPPTPIPLDYKPLGDEPQASQPLPWMNWREPSLYQHLECLLIPSGLTMILIVMIPIWSIRATLRSSSAVVAAVPLIILCAFAAVGTLGPFTQAASSAIALALPILLLVRWWKQRRAGDMLLAASALVLLIIPLVVLHFTPHYLGATRGPWFWLDELLMEPLLVGLAAGLPGYIYWKTIVRMAIRGDWRRIRILLAGTTVLALILAALIIGLNTRWRFDVEYSWNGWYIIWFWGAFVTGLAAASGTGLQAIYTRFQRVVQRPAVATR